MCLWVEMILFENTTRQYSRDFFFFSFPGFDFFSFNQEEYYDEHEYGAFLE